MVSFENTEIAFQGKTNKDLARARFLFKMVGSNALVKTGKALAQFAIKLHLPVAWAAKPTVYSHFVGGESIEECMPNVRLLEKYKVRAILDYSVEGTESIDDINRAMEETLKTIHNAANDPNIPFAVFKPTAFTWDAVLTKVSTEESLTPDEQAESEAFRQRVEKLCRTAFENDVPILIDAEDYCYQKFIDEVVEENMERFNSKRAIVFNTFQMYRWDRLEKLEQMHARAVEKNYYLGAKFVRGAYLEREQERAHHMGYKDPIQPDKESTDRDYNAALKFCIDHIERITVFNGTHNEYSTRYMAELMDEHQLAKDDPRCWFAQLYGMSDHISFNMANAGYNVAKYMPFGPVNSVLPYLIRRTEENTSIAGQTSRELGLLLTETERRKKLK